MSKIIELSELVDLGRALGIKGVDSLTAAIEATTDILAQKIADALDIEVKRKAELLEPGMGGLCVSFCKKFPDQVCPPLLADFDPSGDWE